MTRICEDCPIILGCALHALSEKGGFYAGVWIPWDKSTSPALVDDRRAARTALRQLVRA